MSWQIAVNIAVAILMPLVIFALGYIVSLSKRVTDLRVLVADEFVRKPEIDKLSATMNAIQTTLQELLKTVAEMKGSMKAGAGQS